MFRIEDYQTTNEDGEIEILQPVGCDDAPEVFGFDRRRAERHEITCAVTAMRREHDADAYQHPACHLELCNMSETGVAAISDVPLDPDSPISILFPPHGGDAAIQLTGHVVRCRPWTGDDDATDRPRGGYEIAIAFDPAVAA